MKTKIARVKDALIDKARGVEPADQETKESSLFHRSRCCSVVVIMNRCGFKQQFRFDLGSIPSSAIGVDLIIFFYFAKNFLCWCVFVFSLFCFCFEYYIYLLFSYIFISNLSLSMVYEFGWLSLIVAGICSTNIYPALADN
ncbi:hypothetical protein P168DRAFT_96317 [Aspergillus campestris IBT 28561]|uniref:Uncharacterized protein n=1 Tax=Aspergillus campestris (strain IBT 28561) TaxID=1392248 RepID=A0A2I1DC45_ASPC2|nr:uncharacterized protein P168DRAFT_96317 [Aspergillus campestris IBT 28561]PKY07443.1 hypothetical protein P168DRAFT_96317 [Aspergillus campestris IBT 28561]